MNKEKDFFKTCFNTVAGLEVKNESQAIAKEVVLSEVKNLQQENKRLKENAENNDKVVDKVNWENQLLKKENRELKTQIEEYQKALDETMSEKIDIENNWNKLKEYISTEWYSYDNDSVEFEVAKDILNKMQEMEKSDSNDSN